MERDRHRQEEDTSRACLHRVRACAEPALVVEVTTRSGEAESLRRLQGRSLVQVREDKGGALGSHNAPGTFQVIPNATLVPSMGVA